MFGEPETIRATRGNVSVFVRRRLRRRLREIQTETWNPDCRGSVEYSVLDDVSDLLYVRILDIQILSYFFADPYL